MFIVRKEIFTAYVVFMGADHSIWWRLFTRRGLRHVQLFIPADEGKPLYSDGGRVIAVNALSYSVSISIIDKPIEDVIEACQEAGASLILRFPVNKRFTREFVPRGILTCVSLIKSILGISAFTVITPEQLARWLIRNGAKKV